MGKFELDIEYGSHSEIEDATLKTRDGTPVLQYTPKKGGHNEEFVWYGKRKQTKLNAGWSDGYGHFYESTKSAEERDIQRALFAMFEHACDHADGLDSVPDAACHKLVRDLAKLLWTGLTGPWGETLLHIAAKHGRKEAMEELLKRGADARAKTSFRGRTAEDYLKEYQKEQEKSEVRSMRRRLAAEKDKADKEKASRKLKERADIRD